MIAELLGTGRESARTGREICGALNISHRVLTLAIENERKHGEPICASCGPNPGYYLAADKEEMQDYCNSLNRRLNEMGQTWEACSLTIETLPEAVYYGG